MEYDKDKTEYFIQLLSSNHYRIYAFISGLVLNSSDADDIMQDTSSIMWRKFDEFKDGTDFVAWGVTIAKFRVMEYRKKKKDTYLSEEAIELLANQSAGDISGLDDKLQALSSCLTKLPAQDCNMLKMRYTHSHKARTIAQRFGTSVHMVYRNMARIKLVLADCIEKQLKAEGY